MRFRIRITREMQFNSDVFDQGLNNTNEYKALIARALKEGVLMSGGCYLQEEQDHLRMCTMYSGRLPDWPEASAFVTLLQSIARGYR